MTLLELPNRPAVYEFWRNDRFDADCDLLAVVLPLDHGERLTPQLVEAKPHRSQFQPWHHAFERVIDADDAYVFGNPFTCGTQSEHRAVCHLIVRRIHCGAFLFVGKRQTCLVSAVGSPIADVKGRYCGSDLGKGVMSSPDAALRRAGSGRARYVVHGMVPFGKQIIHGCGGTSV